MKKNKFRNLYEEHTSTEINLTPLIDTVLVLLIVFILFIPQVDSLMHIVLPSQKNTQMSEKNHKKEYLCLLINQFGEIFIKHNIKIKNREITDYIIEQIKQNSYREAIIFADKDTLLENVTKVVDILYGNGIQKVYIKTKKL
jgi:biopolymer transport protein ExbD